MQRKFIIGLTGNSGSGKSTVAKILEDAGAEIIDADKIVRELQQIGNEGHAEIFNAFGCEYFLPDGNIDRRKLSELVFSSASERKRLNDIIHPMVQRKVREIINTTKSDVIVYDVPIVEKKVGFDELWVTSAPYETKIKRIMQRDSIPIELAQKRLSSQIDQQQLILMADRVIDTDVTLDCLRKAVLTNFDKAVRGYYEGKKV